MVDTLQTTPDTTDLGELAQLYAASLADTEFGPLLARVLTYDSSRQVATVQPLVLRWSSDGVGRPFPSLHDVPVAWPGNAIFSATFPLSPGDVVHLKVLAVDHSTWVGSASADQMAPTPRRFKLADVIAQPGGLSPAQPLGSDAIAADGYVIRATPFIYLGSSAATDFVALASKVLTELNAIKSYLDLLKGELDKHGHVETGGVTLDQFGAPSTPLPGGFSVAPTPGSVASAKVKSE